MISIQPPDVNFVARTVDATSINMKCCFFPDHVRLCPCKWIKHLAY